MKTLAKAISIAVLTLAASAHAETIWMTGDNGVALYKVDSTDGASTLVGNFGQPSTYTLSFSQSGTLYGISNGFGIGNLVTIDQATGHATTVGSTGVSSLMSLAFASDGTLYTASWATNSLYTLNPLTGASTLVGALGFDGVMDLDFDAEGNLYGLSDSLYRIDVATGHGTLVTHLANTCLMGMAIDASDRFYGTDWCSGNTPLYQIDTANGSLTSLGATGISGAMGGAFAPAADVPEPATLGLLGLGLLGVASARRKLGAKKASQ